MKRITTFFLFLTVGVFTKLAACSCHIIPTFCETLTFGNNGQILDYLSVHRIKVNAKLPNGLNVSVLETYTGENLVGHDLFIQDGNGANCVLFASQFLEEEAEYIISSTGNSNTIEVSECGVGFLKVENGMVKGAIASGIDEVPLVDFPSTANCGDLTPAAVVDPGVLGGLVVRPTIVTGEVEVRTKSFSQVEDLQVRVFDAGGKLVFEQLYLHFGFYSQIKLDMSDWGAGIYFIHAMAGGQRVTEKLVKINSN
jgi:hypothetical protein